MNINAPLVGTTAVMEKYASVWGFFYPLGKKVIPVALVVDHPYSPTRNFLCLPPTKPRKHFLILCLWFPQKIKSEQVKNKEGITLKQQY